MNLLQLEEVICQVPAVDAARVVGTGNTVHEVHIVSSIDKPAKHIVRDIQSIALATMGVNIDRRAVSVVQVASGVHTAGERIEIVDINEQIDGSKAEISVLLSWGSDTAKGTASGSAAQAVRPRLIGEATLDALEAMTTAEHSVALAALETPTVGGTVVAISKVVLVTEGQERILIGSALADADTRTACVRSVLDAVNRYIPRLRR